MRQKLTRGTGSQRLAIFSEARRKKKSADLCSMRPVAAARKLTLPDSFLNFIPSQIQHNKIEILPVCFPYLEEVSTLPFHHKDPFDCLVFAQSTIENLPVVSSARLLIFIESNAFGKK